MKKITIAMLVAMSSLLLSAGASAQVVGNLSDQIRWRQSAYHVMAWSMKRIHANLSGSYNKEQVAQAANVISAIANSKMGLLFQPDSDMGEGWKVSRLKSNFFTDRDTLIKVAGNFAKQANAMASVAAHGDAAAAKRQFGKLGKACKSCHKKIPG